MTLRIALAVFVSVLVLIVGFALFIPHANKGGEAGPVTSTSSPSVTIHDVYKKGVHTITGSIPTPTPCVRISAEAAVEAPDIPNLPPIITVSITMPPDTGVCLQEQAIAIFSLSVQASQDATVKAIVNGLVASTTMN